MTLLGSPVSSSKGFLFDQNQDKRMKILGVTFGPVPVGVTRCGSVREVGLGIISTICPQIVKITRSEVPRPHFAFVTAVCFSKLWVRIVFEARFRFLAARWKTNLMSCGPAQDHWRKIYWNMMRSRRIVMMGMLIDENQNENTEIAKNTFNK